MRGCQADAEHLCSERISLDRMWRKDEEARASHLGLTLHQLRTARLKSSLGVSP